MSEEAGGDGGAALACVCETMMMHEMAYGEVTGYSSNTLSTTGS